MDENYKIIKTIFEDAVLIESQQRVDERGCFFEIYNEDFMKKIEFKAYQQNIMISKKGVLRGIHFYINNPQKKIITVLKGSIYEVLVDIRRDSKTFGCYESVILSDNNKYSLYIPEGFAHGYVSLESDTIVAFNVSSKWEKNSESGIIWNDEHLDIRWPVAFNEIIISNKDKHFDSFIKLCEEGVL